MGCRTTVRWAHPSNGAWPPYVLFLRSLVVLCSVRGGNCVLRFSGGLRRAYFLKFRLHSLVTTGIITSVDVDADGDESLYCPHFRFEAADKRTYTGGCRIWDKSAAQPFAVGAPVVKTFEQD